MNAIPKQPDFDWVIIGGGPIGTHVAVRLIASNAAKAARIRIVDPGTELLHRWKTCTDRTGMQYLRSPAVHHIGVTPFELLQFAGRKKRERRRNGLFTEPFQRPSLELFHKHCSSIIEKFGLADLHIQDQVKHIRVGSEAVELELINGSLSTAQVIFAIGNGDHPSWPEETLALKQDGGQVLHLFEDAVPFEADDLPKRVAVLGGGISAAQLAVRLAKAGKTVTILARHEPQEHQFDSDPGWIGPKLMNGFLATPDYKKRRAMIRAARHRGSMPKDVLRQLNQAMNHHSLEWRVGQLTESEVTEKRTIRLKFGQEHEPLDVDALVLATGFEPKRPGGELVDQLIEDNDLPLSKCGYPSTTSQIF